MSFRTRAFAMALLAAPGGACRGQGVPPPSDASASVTASASYASQYFFRGLRFGGQALQPSVEMDRGPWSLGVWGSTPLAAREKVHGQSDPEVDLYGAWTRALSARMSLLAGFTWYLLPKAPTNEGFYRMSFEPSLGASFSVKGLRLTPRAYYDCVLKGPTWEFAAAYAVPLGSIGTEVDLTGTAGTYSWTDSVHGSSPRTRAWGDYWLAGASIPYQLPGFLRLTAGWAYTAGSSAFQKTGAQPRVRNPLAAGRGVLTLTLAKTF